MPSLQQRLRDVPAELRMAGLAATALALSLVLPWYQKSVIPPGGHVLVQENLSALAVFSFVEAAVLLVAAAVLFLIWARTQGRGFHLPGGDGSAITLAGGWAMLLLVWRLFDKPDAPGTGATVGIQWGIFGAMIAAGALIAAGARVRAAHRPEPPNPAAEDLAWEAPSQRPRRSPDRRPRDAGAVTEALREPPSWQGEPPPGPGEPPPRSNPRDGGPGGSRRAPSDPPTTPDRLF